MVATYPIAIAAVVALIVLVVLMAFLRRRLPAGTVLTIVLTAGAVSAAITGGAMVFAMQREAQMQLAQEEEARHAARQLMEEHAEEAFEELDRLLTHEAARVGEARSEVRALFDAVEMYKLRTGGYLPESLQELIDGPPDYEGYWQNLLQSDTVPLDPWDHPYVYEITDADWGEYRILSYGADGAPGGEGFDADITWPPETDED